jgi:GDPmannose 4,6-dehydratase
MWLMLQADSADDYVIATGETHSVREFCELAFELAGMPIKWRGKELAEVGVDASGAERVRIDPRYFRPAEVDALQGDSSYARKKLGWKPTVSFEQLVKMMVEADMKQAAVQQ